MTPIDRLPPELLYTVFWGLLIWNPGNTQPIKSSDYYRGLNLLRLVSPYWSACIDNNTLFWAVAASEAPSPIFAGILQKSGQIPLYACYSETSSKECLGMLVEQSYRWCGLQVEITTDAEVLFSQRAPLLKTVHASVHSSPDSPVVFAFAAEDFSSADASILWTGVFHKWDIRTLGLANIENNNHPPTVDEFLDILNSCPNLVNVSVDYVTIRIPSGLGSNRTVPVVLPYLKSLFIRDVSDRATRLVLDHLVIPQGAMVSVHSQGMYNSLNYLIPPIVRRLTTTGGTQDSEGQLPMVVYLQGSRTTFNVVPNLWVSIEPPLGLRDPDQWEPNDPIPPFRYFCLYTLRRLEPKDYPTMLVLQRTEAHHVALLVPELDRCFPDTLAISLAHPPSADDLLQNVENILMCEFATHPWPFPKLSALSLLAKTERYDSLVEIVKRRVEVAQDERSGVAKLHTVLLTGGRIGRAALEALRSLVVQVVSMSTEIVD